MPVIFLHIPKTAGSTFSALLLKLYRKYPILDLHAIDRQYHLNYEDYFKNNAISKKKLREIVFNTTSNRRYRLVIGHEPFGIHTLFDKPSTYLTFLRDPLTQIKSHYHYLAGSDLYEHKNLLQNRDFEAFISSKYAQNFQAKYFFGDHYPNFLEKYEKGEDIKPLIFDFITKNSIQIGLTERFNDSILYFKHILKWGNNSLQYKTINVNSQKPKKTALNENAVALIRANSPIDLLLYECGKSHFETQWNLFSPWKRQLTRIADKNKQLNILLSKTIL
ncbi:MAG: sulfotransferase family 2 domain-containing protein [Chitinophagales bacterium]|nr:sulfotransferase family 2 domain-containing protein [Bacteroidota bacterium]MCB9042758.1 sulfotransferase family 2 domain-containing protein [Chitinophagales bacterium]